MLSKFLTVIASGLVTASLVISSTPVRARRHRPLYNVSYDPTHRELYKAINKAFTADFCKTDRRHRPHRKLPRRLR